MCPAVFRVRKFEKILLCKNDVSSTIVSVPWERKLITVSVIGRVGRSGRSENTLPLRVAVSEKQTPNVSVICPCITLRIWSTFVNYF